MKKLTINIAILLTLFLLAGSTIAQTGKTNLLPIIDMHVHCLNKIWLDNGAPMPRLCFPEPCYHTPAMVKKDEDLLPLTIEAMDKYNIVKGVISWYGVESVAKWKKAAPERFMAGIVYGSPAYTNALFNDKPLYIDLGVIRQELEKGNVEVIGEITSQYFNYAADDPALDPIFSLAEEFDVPVHIHCGGLGGDPGFPISKGSPMHVSEVLRKHPKLRIYLENASWPFLEEVTSLMYTYPNVYADLSTITWIIPRKTFHTYLKGLIDAGLDKRLMFGSDAMNWPEAIGLAVEAIKSADFLTIAQKRDIFYNNAARFLRLSEEEIARHNGK